MNFPPTSAEVHKLDSGLTAILDPDKDSQVISTQFWVETGSMHETAHAGAGLSHLLEHMVFKGSANFSGDELAERVQGAGGQWNAYTSFDRTVYYIDGPAHSLETFISTLAELTFRPTFPLEDYEREKDVIRREIDMGLDDPNSVSSYLLFDAFYQQDNRRHPVIGHRAQFDAVTHDEMLAYHGARYRPENIFVIISGGFDQEQALALLNTEIAKGLPARREFPVICPDEPRPLFTRRASQAFAVPSTHLSMCWQIPGLDHPDTVALEILSTVLGGGHSTPLYQNIREKQNLAHHIGAYTWAPPRGPGMFCVYAENPPEKTGKLEEAIYHEIDHLPQLDLATALKRAQRQITTQQFKSLTTAAGRAGDLASNWHQTRNLDFTRDYLQLIATLTPDDLLRVAKKWLTPQKLTIATLVPETEEKKEPLQKTHRKKSALTEHQLSNGLRLILQNDPRVPIIYSHASILTGANSESSSTAGINTLHASLLTKGTRNKNANLIAETLEDHGAAIRASSGNNTSSLSAFCLNEDIQKILPLYTEILSTPTFPDDSLQRERHALIADIEESLEDPAARAFLELRKGLWGDQSYGLPSHGTPDTLNSLHQDALAQHHQKHFTADQTVIATFGDLDPPEIIDLFEKHLNEYPQKGIDTKRTAAQIGSGEKNITLGKQQAVIAIGYPGLAQDDPRQFALSLLHHYCSDMAGPLFSRIREELGLAYYVTSTYFLGCDTGMLAFYLGTSPEQLDLARAELTKEIETISQKGIPQDAFQRVQANAIASEALKNQSPSARARMSALDVLFGQAADHHLSVSEHLKKVTSQHVSDLARELLTQQSPLIVTVTP